jgi:hypothetical protein
MMMIRSCDISVVVDSGEYGEQPYDSSRQLLFVTPLSCSNSPDAVLRTLMSPL